MSNGVGSSGGGLDGPGGVIVIIFVVAIGLTLMFYDKAPVEQPPECPPFDQCTPKGDWNNPNCKCWDSK